MHTVIKAIACRLPDTMVTNAHLVESGRVPFGVDAIVSKVGVASRQVAEAHESTGDLAVAAATKLLDAGVVERDQIDWLIVCTQTPDNMVPATACWVQHELGLPCEVACFDIGLSCSGYVYGLTVADGLIRSGQARRILLLNGDTYTKFLHPNDAKVITIFGDGAAATLLEAHEDDGVGLLAHKLGTDGSGYDKLIQHRGGSRSPHVHDEHDVDASENYITMDGPAIFRFALRVVPQNILGLLGEQGLSVDDVDMFVLHQASSYMLETLQRRMGIRAERFPIDMVDTGNTVSASIPLVLHRKLAASANGLGGTLALFCGFGAGLSYGSVLYRFPAEGAFTVH